MQTDNRMKLFQAVSAAFPELEVVAQSWIKIAVGGERIYVSWAGKTIETTVSTELAGFKPRTGNGKIESRLDADQSTVAASLGLLIAAIKGGSFSHRAVNAGPNRGVDTSAFLAALKVVSPHASMDASEDAQIAFENSVEA